MISKEHKEMYQKLKALVNDGKPLAKYFGFNREHSFIDESERILYGYTSKEIAVGLVQLESALTSYEEQSKYERSIISEHLKKMRVDYA